MMVCPGLLQDDDDDIDDDGDDDDKDDETQNGHNSANFEATTSRFCMKIDINGHLLVFPKFEIFLGSPENLKYSTCMDNTRSL